jgi:hypothetical protein
MGPARWAMLMGAMPWHPGSLTFPPGGSGLLLSPGPPSAVRNGLGLFDAHTPLRELAVSGARVLAGSPATLLFRSPRAARSVDTAFWDRWVAEVAEPVTGPVGSAALARRTGRDDVLLMDRRGVPLAFVKMATSPEARQRMERERGILLRLQDGRPAAFRVPRVVDRGGDGERTWHILEPLPDGPHTRPPEDEDQIAAIVDDLRRCLAGHPRPAETPAHFVPGHGDLTHRNLRRASDGRLWLFDWEYARWMPRLADELRYWAAHFAFGVIPRPRASARRILEILRGRGTDGDVREAVAWPEFNRPGEAAIREAVRSLLGPGPVGP